MAPAIAVKSLPLPIPTPTICTPNIVLPDRIPAIKPEMRFPKLCLVFLANLATEAPKFNILAIIPARIVIPAEVVIPAKACPEPSRRAGIHASNKLFIFTIIILCSVSSRLEIALETASCSVASETIVRSAVAPLSSLCNSYNLIIASKNTVSARSAKVIMFFLVPVASTGLVILARPVIPAGVVIPTKVGIHIPPLRGAVKEILEIAALLFLIAAT